MPVLEQFHHRYGLNIVSPDLYHLRAIGVAFSHLPYENVTKILKDTRSASSTDKLRRADEVLEDHLRWNTGGTCFSLCNTLQSILRNSGFDAWIGMADMHYGANIHCAVIVQLAEGRYLLDPGYLMHAPVRLPGIDDGDGHLRTPMNTIIVRAEAPDVYSIYTQESGTEKWRYRLRSTPTPPDELEQHWIRSFSLNTMEHVMMSRLSENGRLYFRKNRLEQVAQEQRRAIQISANPDFDLSSVFGVPADLIHQARMKVLGRSS